MIVNTRTTNVAYHEIPPLDTLEAGYLPFDSQARSGRFGMTSTQPIPGENYLYELCTSLILTSMLEIFLG